jgi:Uma2 family endonuclease
MANVKAVLTYRDFAVLPNDGKRHEILDGELSVTAAPCRAHQHVVLRLGAALDAHVAEHDLGEVYIAPFDVILAETTIVEPDILFVASDRLGTFSARGLEGAPTLVIEILSPSTTHVDRGRKLQLYARYGVPYYWIVDPEQRVIDGYRLVAGAHGVPERFSGAMLTGLPPFEGLVLDPARLWRH